MTPTPSAQPTADAPDRFTALLVEAGVDVAVAADLERRIEVVETEEASDESRRALSGREILVFALVTVVAVVVGLVVVIL